MKNSSPDLFFESPTHKYSLNGDFHPAFIGPLRVSKRINCRLPVLKGLDPKLNKSLDFGGRAPRVAVAKGP